jgi:hypothetical protein
MQKLFKIMFIALVGIFGSGCATSTTESKTPSGATRTEWRLGMAERSVERAQRNPTVPVVTQPGSPDVVMNGAYAMPASLPPPNVAQLHKPLPGCGKPFALVIENDSAYYMAVHVNGVQLRVFGRMGELPSFIPPHQKAYTCLESVGQTDIAGIAYGRRGRELKEVDRFQIDERFTPSSAWAAGFQKFTINDKTLRWR